MRQWRRTSRPPRKETRQPAKVVWSGSVAHVGAQESDPVQGRRVYLLFGHVDWRSVGDLDRFKGCRNRSDYVCARRVIPNPEIEDFDFRHAGLRTDCSVSTKRKDPLTLRADR